MLSPHSRRRLTLEEVIAYEFIRGKKKLTIGCTEYHVRELIDGIRRSKGRNLVYRIIEALEEDEEAENCSFSDEEESKVLKIFLPEDIQAAEREFKALSDLESAAFVGSRRSVVPSLGRSEIVKLAFGPSHEFQCLGLVLEAGYRPVSEIIRGFRESTEGPVLRMNLRATALQIAEALAGLHACGYVHADLKPENVVNFSSTGSLLKLIDLEACQRVGLPLTGQYTLPYCPPEMVTRSLSSSDGTVFADTSYDIWCFGVLLLKMFCGEHFPLEFSGLSASQMVQKLASDGFAFEESLKHIEVHRRNLRHLIRQCLRRNPEERVTAEQILQHPFFADNPTRAAFPASLGGIASLVAEWVSGPTPEVKNEAARMVCLLSVHQENEARTRRALVELLIETESPETKKNAANALCAFSSSGVVAALRRKEVELAIELLESFRYVPDQESQHAEKKKLFHRSNSGNNQQWDRVVAEARSPEQPAPAVTLSRSSAKRHGRRQSVSCIPLRELRVVVEAESRPRRHPEVGSKENKVGGGGSPSQSFLPERRRRLDNALTEPAHGPGRDSPMAMSASRMRATSAVMAGPPSKSSLRTSSAVCKTLHIESGVGISSLQSNDLEAVLRILIHGSKSGRMDYLQSLSENPEERRRLLDAGALRILVRYLNPEAEQKKTANAVRVLWYLATDQSARKKIQEAGAIPKLVGVLSYGSDTAKQYAACALWSLSTSEHAIQVDIANVGGIPLLTQLLRDGTDIAKDRAVAALANIAMANEARQAIVAENVLSPLIALLCQHNRRFTHLKEASATLASCLPSEEDGTFIRNQAAKQEEGSFNVTNRDIEKLIDRLVSGTATAQEEVALSLWALATQSEEIQRMVVLSDGIWALITSLRDRSVVKKDAATSLLVLLATCTSRDAVSRAGGIALAVDLMRDSAVTFMVHESAVALLRRLAEPEVEGDEAVNDLLRRQRITEVGGVWPLVDLATHGTAVARQHAAAVLFYLCQSEAFLLDMVLAGAIGPLVRLLSDEHSMEFAAGALCRLVSVNDASRSAVADAVPHFFEVLCSSKASPKAKESAVMTIASVASVYYERTIEVAHLGGVQALVPVVREGIALEPATLILLLLTRLEANQEKFISAGGLAALRDALISDHEWSDDRERKKFEENAVKIVWNFAICSEYRTEICRANLLPPLARLLIDGEPDVYLDYLVESLLGAVNGDIQRLKHLLKTAEDPSYPEKVELLLRHYRKSKSSQKKRATPGKKKKREARRLAMEPSPEEEPLSDAATPSPEVDNEELTRLKPPRNRRSTSGSIRKAAAAASLELRLEYDWSRRKVYRTRSASNGMHSVACKGCGMTPIRGRRYSCLECEAFDFCEACRMTKAHTRTHRFEEIVAGGDVGLTPARETTTGSDLSTPALSPYEPENEEDLHALVRSYTRMVHTMCHTEDEMSVASEGVEECVQNWLAMLGNPHATVDQMQDAVTSLTLLIVEYAERQRRLDMENEIASAFDRIIGNRRLPRFMRDSARVALTTLRPKPKKKSVWSRLWSS